MNRLDVIVYAGGAILIAAIILWAWHAYPPDSYTDCECKTYAGQLHIVDNLGADTAMIIDGLLCWPPAKQPGMPDLIYVMPDGRVQSFYNISAWTVK